MEGIHRIETIGILATIVGVISFIPIVYVVYKTRKTNNFPYPTLYLAILSNLLWIIYGLYEPAFATIFQGALYFLIYTYVLYIKFLY